MTSDVAVNHKSPSLLWSTGKGTVVYKNGDKYEGDWSNDLRHGLGTLWIYKGGKTGKYVVRYNGEWRDDQPTVGAGCMKGNKTPLRQTEEARILT